MKTIKKTIAAALVVLTTIILLPCVPLSKAAEGGFCLSEEARADALEELISFSERLAEMRKRFGTDYKSKDISDPYSTSRIIVKSALELDFPGSLAHVGGHNDITVVQYPDPVSAKAACEYFDSMPGVLYAEPDIILHADAAPGSDYFRSWGYNEYNANAFDFNEWLVSFYGGVEDMPIVKVAVLDTGVDSDHPFLEGRLLPGYDFANNDSDPEEDHHHGTHVTGIVVDGTLPNVKILPVKVLDNTAYAETSTVALGIEYSLLMGSNVINMSLGGDCDGINGEEHMLMEEWINKAADMGAVVCVAAGNDSADADIHCPANVQRAITVASITESHELSVFSNYGPIVDIMAPGSRIISSYVGGRFAALSGTSMAAPHVSAAAAMLKTFSPALNADVICELLKAAAVDIGVDNAGSGMLCVTGIYERLSFIPGDVDMNGAVNANDALLILRYSLGLISENSLELRCADFDSDSAVTANDALLVLRLALGVTA